MAKRARGTVRPGQRRPIERRAAAPDAPVAPALTPAIAKRPSGLTAAEAARAAEQTRRRSKDRASRDIVISTGTLAKRAEQEYAYVGRDLRDIVRIAVIMLVILFSLYIAIDVAKVIPIG